MLLVLYCDISQYTEMKILINNSLYRQSDNITYHVQFIYYCLLDQIMGTYFISVTLKPLL